MKSPLTFSETPESITSKYQSEIKRLETQLAAVVAAQGNGFDRTTREFEFALAEFSRNLTHVLFLKDVSPNEEVREAAARCDTQVQQFFVDVFAREDLFRTLKADEGKVSDKLDSRLLDEHLAAFRRNGLELPPEKRAQYIGKKKELVEVEEEFGKRLIEWKDELWVTAEELRGLPENYISNLETSDGKYRLKLDYPHYFTFMENSCDAAARARFEQKFFNRGGERNAELLENAIKLRAELAQLLGFPTHAHYVLDRRMAKKPEAVTKFLDRLEPQLKALAKEELKELLRAKQIDFPESKSVTSSDWRYYDNQQRKTKYEIDSQLVREYFPTNHVLEQMFEIYQALLDVKFIPVEDPNAWHPDVKLHAIERDGQVAAYFYLDLYPREGKYGHAAAFQIVSGYEKRDGTYELPVAAMVANFETAAEGQPALISHANVETLFHEFGHIMHQTLTRAKYATFSGTAVKTDFVEAPSQMLENWVWQPEMLQRLSSHWKDRGKKLPEKMIQKLIEAKMLNSGIRYLRQLSFAKIDLAYHTANEVDSTEIYREITESVMMIPLSENTRPQASFGHLMGGYDSGYYGYLWSEVFAEDMFTRFQGEGLLNPKVGREYLSTILEPGGTRDPNELLASFLKRPPNETAFLKSIGLGS